MLRVLEAEDDADLAGALGEVEMRGAVDADEFFRMGGDETVPGGEDGGGVVEGVRAVSPADVEGVDTGAAVAREVGGSERLGIREPRRDVGTGLVQDVDEGAQLELAEHV